MMNEQERRTLFEKIHSADCPEELHTAYRMGVFSGYGEGIRQAQEDAIPDLSEDEIAYRQGFAHGFVVARNKPSLTVEEVFDWKNSKKQVPPPGSTFGERI